MRKIALPMLLLSGLLTGCASMNWVGSVTYIEPNKSFVLGDNPHGTYTATVRNASATPVEVFLPGADGVEASLGTLQEGQRKTLPVAKDTRVVFRNNGDSQATLEIQLNGATGLNMGYRPNQ